MSDAHHRGWAEIAEQQVANGLNGDYVNANISKIVDSIKSKYPAIRDAEWIGGGDYSNEGDVLLNVLDPNTNEIRKIRIELKFSKGIGIGTKKNPGAKFFQKQMGDSVMSYTDHENQHKIARYRMVEAMSGTVLTKQKDYCNLLRKYRDDFNVLKNKLEVAKDLKDVDEMSRLTDAMDSHIISQIKREAGIGQSNYAKYIADISNTVENLDIINTKIVPMFLGKDDSQVINDSGEPLEYCVINNFEHPSQIVEFLDFSDMDKRISKVESSGKSILLKNRADRIVLRFSVNWKNICQGGATPSFNVFVGNEFSRN